MIEKHCQHKRFVVKLTLKLLMDELLPASARVLLTQDMMRLSPTASPSPMSSRTFNVYLCMLNIEVVNMQIEQLRSPLHVSLKAVFAPHKGT